MFKRLAVLSIVVAIALARVVMAQTEGPGDAIEASGMGRINWTTGEVFATGIGAPPTKAANPAQAHAMAERAAVVVAYRNLLEIVKGVRVDSETVVENFMVKSDTIKAQVNGIVKGARIAKKQYMSDGSVEVLVAMPMRGAFIDILLPESFGKLPQSQAPLKTAPLTQRPPDIMQPQPPLKPSEPAKLNAPKTSLPPIVIPQEKKPKPPKQPEPSRPQVVVPQEKKTEPPRQPEPSRPLVTPGGGSTIAFKDGTATGLVIDGRNLGLRPALLPKIVDVQGQEIYVGQVVTRTNAVDQGVAGYAKDVNAAANNFRVTDNPAVIKGLRATGSARTDIVVGQADAQMLRQLSGRGNFLQYCRVIIVY